MVIYLEPPPFVFASSGGSNCSIFESCVPRRRFMTEREPEASSVSVESISTSPRENGDDARDATVLLQAELPLLKLSRDSAISKSS